MSYQMVEHKGRKLVESTSRPSCFSSWRVVPVNDNIHDYETSSPSAPLSVFLRKITSVRKRNGHTSVVSKVVYTFIEGHWMEGKGTRSFL